MQQDTVQIEIDDFVGVGNASFQEVKRQISSAKGKKLRAVVNGYGGYVTDGVGIYNLLRGHDGPTETHIATWAFSADTIIAMGGRHRTMAENGFFMVHNPLSLAIGEAEELESEAAVLRMMEKQLIDIYARETKLGKRKIKEMMDAETWLSAQEALELGFVHELTAGAKILNHFDPTVFFQHYQPRPTAAAVNSNTQKSNIMNSFEEAWNAVKKWFNKSDATITEVTAELERHGSLDAMRTAMRTELQAELQASHDQATADLQSQHETALGELQQQLATAQTDLATATARIAELEQEPAATATKGKHSSEGAAEGNRTKCKITERAAAAMRKEKLLPF